MRGPEERLQDMLEAVAAIERYRHLGREELERNELLQVWFVHHLRIIGEAARAMPEEVRRLAPEVPWRQLVGMRHVLVHGYFHIDTDLVWETVQRDVPALRPSLEALLRRLQAGEAS